MSSASGADQLLKLLGGALPESFIAASISTQEAPSTVQQTQQQEEEEEEEEAEEDPARDSKARLASLFAGVRAPRPFPLHSATSGGRSGGSGGSGCGTPQKVVVFGARAKTPPSSSKVQPTPSPGPAGPAAKVNVTLLDGRTRRIKESLAATCTQLEADLKAVTFDEELLCLGDKEKKRVMQDLRRY